MTWRRFCVLLAGLSAESRFLMAASQDPKPVGEDEFHELMGSLGRRVV
jgi:hypothetical protein